MTTFDKTGLGLEVKELYGKLMEMRKEEGCGELDEGEGEKE